MYLELPFITRRSPSSFFFFFLNHQPRKDYLRSLHIAWEEVNSDLISKTSSGKGCSLMFKGFKFGGEKLKTYVRYLEKENFFFPLESKALVICSLLSVQVGFSSYRHFFSQVDLPGCWLSSFLPLLYSSCNQNAISCHPPGINYNPISFRKTFWLMQVYSQFST